MESRRARKWELAHKQLICQIMCVDISLTLFQLTTMSIRFTRNVGWRGVATGTQRCASYVGGLQHLCAGPVCNAAIHWPLWCRTLRNGQSYCWAPLRLDLWYLLLIHTTQQVNTFGRRGQRSWGQLTARQVRTEVCSDTCRQERIRNLEWTAVR